MQQTNQMIHIKVALNNEFRRFSMDKTNYSELVDMIRTLYSLPTGALKICYVDDEADTVLITSDEEFSYAAELIHPLKLVLTHSPTSIPVLATIPCEVDAAPETTFPSCRRGGRGRGNCGEFRPRCEFKQKWREEKLTLTEEEKISRKTARISQRIQHLEELSLQDLPAHRARTVAWKLEKLRSKQGALRFLSGVTSTSCEGGRGPIPANCGPIGILLDTPLWQCPGVVIATPDSGDQSELDTCCQFQEETIRKKWEAKREAKREVKSGERSSCQRFLEKDRKRECMKNLREARASGDAEKIKECVNALIEAKEALQKAKVVRRC